MATSSTMLVKVKHGNTIRRFAAQISGNTELNLTMDGLRNKILSLFGFHPDTKLMLTYIDEDDDVVTLADDDDLCDAIKQNLEPLRITVKVNAKKDGIHSLKTLPVPLSETLSKLLVTIASSTELVQKSLQNLGVGQMMKTVPETLNENIKKISTDLAAKAKLSVDQLAEKPSLVPGTAEVVVDQLSQPQLGGDDSSSKEKTISKKIEGLEKTKPAVENNEGRIPTLQQFHNSIEVNPATLKLDSCFIKDVNIVDGTVMAPLTPFTKIWRMKNNGNVAWPEKTKLVWIGGDKLSNDFVVEIPKAGLMIDEEFEVGVDFISPKLPGCYVSYWRIALPSGQKFGQRFWVRFQVDSSLTKAPPLEKVRSFNLNLPPVPEIINGDPQPMVEGGFFWPSAPIKYTVKQPNTEQKLKFPINDGASSSRAVSHPITGLADVLPDVPSMGPTGFNQVQRQAPSASAPPVGGLPRKMVKEERLLKKLVDMGFNEVDLNRHMLRKNEYDFAKTLDDLCAVAEWSQIFD